jgi:ABC-type Na+ transport system ATPase subunit NatA
MTIEIENLYKTFGRHEALHGLSLSVPEGSAYALIGANGAGKTTTIKTVMNIIVPTRGVTRILGVDSRRLGVAELRQIGYVSENQDLPARMTVGQYVAYLRPFYPSWDRDLERSISDVINRTNRELRFFDRQGHIHYQVDGSRVADSRLVIQTFVPSDHFTRHLDTPPVRLPELLGVAAPREDRPQVED